LQVVELALVGGAQLGLAAGEDLVFASELAFLKAA
jgi:hypothetical protein